MKTIKNLDTTKLHTDESLGYLGQVAKQTSLVTVEADQIVINTFKSAVQAFEVAMKPNVKNSFTDVRKAADEVADSLWSGANMLAQAMTFHPEQGVKNIADKVFAIFGKYGRLTKMGYKEEYPNMLALLNELKVLPSEEIAALDLQVWIDAMSTAYDNFVSITEEKVNEDAAKQVGITQDCRDAAEAAYYIMVNRINAGASYNGIEPYEKFIDNINVIIDEYKALIASRQTRNANKEKE